MLLIKRQRFHPSELARIKTISLWSGGLQWFCLSGYQSQFGQKNQPDFSCLENEPSASLVKQNPLRRVYRVQCGQKDWYLKQFYTKDLSNALKVVFRANPAKREFENLVIAHGRGMSVPRPLAWARSNRFSLLVTHALTPSQTLESLIWQDPPADQEILEQALLVCAQAIAKMHCNGMTHTDLHSGNILLIPKPKQNPEAYIADLQSARFEQRSGHASASPYHKFRLANFASILSDLSYRINDSQQRLFVRAYLEQMNLLKKWSDQQFDQYFHTVQKHAEAHGRENWRRKDRRLRRNSKYARKIRLGDGWSARVFLQCKHPDPNAPASYHDYTSMVWKQTLSEPAALLNQAEMLKQGGHSTIVAKKLGIGSAVLEVVAKLIFLRQGWRGLLQRIRPSRALRQWLRGHALIHRRLPTAWPLAALEQRKGFLLKQSLLICERVGGAHDLHVLIRDGHLTDSMKLRRILACQLGSLLADLRKKGCRFRDCKAQNILVVQQPGATPPFRLTIIDLDGLALNQRMGPRTKHEALIRLAVSIMRHPNISLRYYLRAFHAYLQKGSMPEAKDRFLRHQLWQKLCRQVLAMRAVKK